MGERASTVYMRSDRKIAKNTLMNWIGKNGQSTEYKHLKHRFRFRGTFLANLAFRTISKRDKTFMLVNASNSDRLGTHWLQFAQAGVKFSLQILLDMDYTIIPMITNTWDILFMKETKYSWASLSNQLTRSCVEFIVFMLLMLNFHLNFLNDMMRFANYMMF